MIPKKRKPKSSDEGDSIETAHVLRRQKGWSMERIAAHLGVHRRTVQRWLHLYDDKNSTYWTGKRFTRNRVPKYGDEIRNEISHLRQDLPSRSAAAIHRMLEGKHEDKSPSPDTVRRVLRELGLTKETSPRKRNYIVFERDFPNELWQIDFKGHEYFGKIGKLYLLAILDDRSRYIVGARWYTSQEAMHVIDLLRMAFKKHGLPVEMLSDNGSQFRNIQGGMKTRYERLLELLGITVTFHHKQHPESKGKVERWFGFVSSNFVPEAKHALEKQRVSTVQDINCLFDDWIEWYNTKHKHSSLEGEPPARVFWDLPGRITRDLDVSLDWDRWIAAKEGRKVSKQGVISVDGKRYTLPSGHAGRVVEVRKIEDAIEVYFNGMRIETFQAIASDNAAIVFEERAIAKAGTFKYRKRCYYVGYKNAHKIVRVQEAANGKELLVYHDDKLLARLSIEDGTPY